MWCYSKCWWLEFRPTNLIGVNSLFHTTHALYLGVALSGKLYVSNVWGWADSQCWPITSIGSQTPGHRTSTGNGDTGNVAKACILLVAGANPNLKDLEGNLPLHLLASDASERVASIESLIEYKADMNASNHRNETPLNLAVKCRFHNVVNTLLDVKADPNSGQSSLLLAMQSLPYRRLVQKLLNCRAHVNVADSQGRSSLHYACGTSSWHLVGQSQRSRPYGSNTVALRDVHLCRQTSFRSQGADQCLVPGGKNSSVCGLRRHEHFDCGVAFARKSPRKCRRPGSNSSFARAGPLWSQVCPIGAHTYRLQSERECQEQGDCVQPHP